MIKLRGKGYHKYQNGFRVEVSLNGFRYNGGLFKTQAAAKQKVKEMLSLIEAGKLSPSYLSGHKSKKTEKRKSLLDSIRQTNGNLAVRNSVEPVNSKEQVKKTNDRLQRAKELAFLPDTDPEVVQVQNRTIEPRRAKPLPEVQGLEILNSLGKSKPKKESVISVTESELAELIASAVAKVMSEKTSGLQGNKKSRR